MYVIYILDVNLQLSTQAQNTHSAHYRSAHSRRAGQYYRRCLLRQM